MNGRIPDHIRWSKTVKNNYLKDVNIESDLISIFGSNPFEYIDPELSHLYTVKNKNKTYGVEFLYELGNRFNIEPFFPFFDRRIIEFSLSVPSSLKLKNGYDRYYFRKSMEGDVPEEITKRTTKADISPFVINEMMNINKSTFNKIVFDNNVLDEVLDKKVVLNEFTRMQEYNDHTFLPNLFRLISIGDWINQKKI